MEKSLSLKAGNLSLFKNLSIDYKVSDFSHLKAMAGKKVQEIPIPIQKKLWRLFIKLLKYPRRVDKRYARYNGAIS